MDRLRGIIRDYLLQLGISIRVLLEKKNLHLAIGGRFNQKIILKNTLDNFGGE